MQYAHRGTALVVENDILQRALVSMLLEDRAIAVIECASAEAAVLVLEHSGANVSLVYTDVNLAGLLDGIDLAYIAKSKFPDLCVVVTSDMPGVRRLPHGAIFMAKPWSPNHLLREAEASAH